MRDNKAIDNLLYNRIDVTDNHANIRTILINLHLMSENIPNILLPMLLKWKSHHVDDHRVAYYKKK